MFSLLFFFNVWKRVTAENTTNNEQLKRMCNENIRLISNGNRTEWSTIRIGNSTVSRGIWDKYREWYFKIHQNITSRRGGEWYLGSFEISRAGIYPKYPEETVLFPVYTTRQKKFALYVTGVIFTCKYFKFGLNTTGLSQSHFRN